MSTSLFKTAGKLVHTFLLVLVERARMEIIQVIISGLYSLVLLHPLLLLLLETPTSVASTPALNIRVSSGRSSENVNYPGYFLWSVRWSPTELAGTTHQLRGFHLPGYCCTASPLLLTN